MHIPYENPEHPEKYIILNHSPYIILVGDFADVKQRELCIRSYALEI